MSDQQVPFWAYPATASLLQLLRFKDQGTFEHCLRVGELSRQLAQKMGMSDYQQKVAEVAGFLHDMGESTIDPDILTKPGKLNPVEYEIMKSHVLASEDFVKPLAVIHPFFKDVQDAIRSHHEFFNGMGYPDKLKGDQIPIIGRIVSLLDAFDSLTTSRVYKEAVTQEKAFLEIDKMAGIQFDRQIVMIFMISNKTFKRSSISELENQLYNAPQAA